MLPIEVPSSFRIIAHRGASAYAPENTIPAFELAEKMGVSEVELDTQLSSDGKVVLCHDPTLERFGHGPKVVEEMRSKDLISLDMGSWFSPHLFRRVPMITLNELFQKFGGRFTYHVELKGKAQRLPHKVNQVIREHGLLDACIATSFSFEHLKRTRETDPGIRLAWLPRDLDSEALARCQDLDLFQIGLNANQVTRELVNLGRSVTPEVRAWGLNGSSIEVVQLIENVVQSGCDGTTINWPDWLVRA